jgi:hypothetical protein
MFLFICPDCLTVYGVQSRKVNRRLPANLDM